MKKSKKIVIGVLGVLLLGGIFCLYSNYNTKFLTNYHNKQSFWQKCERSGGEMKQETECEPTTAALLDPLCIDKNVRCKCPILTIWKDEKGCAYF